MDQMASLAERAEQDGYLIWFTSAKSATPHCQLGRRRVRTAVITLRKWYRRMLKSRGVDGKLNPKGHLILGPPSHRHFRALVRMPGRLWTRISPAADKTVQTVTIGRTNFGKPKRQLSVSLNIH